MFICNTSWIDLFGRSRFDFDLVSAKIVLKLRLIFGKFLNKKVISKIFKHEVRQWNKGGHHECYTWSWKPHLLHDRLPSVSHLYTPFPHRLHFNCTLIAKMNGNYANTNCWLELRVTSITEYVPTLLSDSDWAKSESLYPPTAMIIVVYRVTARGRYTLPNPLGGLALENFKNDANRTCAKQM